MSGFCYLKTRGNLLACSSFVQADRCSLLPRTQSTLSHPSQCVLTTDRSLMAVDDSPHPHFALAKRDSITKLIIPLYLTKWELECLLALVTTKQLLSVDAVGVPLWTVLTPIFVSHDRQTFDQIINPLSAFALAMANR